MSKKDLNDTQQKTLLQFWNNKNGVTKPKESKINVNKPRTSNDIILIDDDDDGDNEQKDNQDDDDDDFFNDADLEMIKASETMMVDKSRNSFMNNTAASTSRVESSLLESNRSNVTVDEPVLTTIDHGPLLNTNNTDTTGYDYNSGSVWIYPNNMPIRAYQFNIIQQCLYKNTMVVLPTGLGKTFVAAVVMLNFYRWYPVGKIIFMAPTKPLVNQQSDACCKIVGITKTDMCQMTGQMNPDKRKTLWSEKRVFFLTPQVISNDILRGNVDVSQIKCVVIDEAHKALGEYAFCTVIQSIFETNKNFRVIALTATPGSDIKTVQGIISSLLISHIELRSDESIDIQQYNHGRQVNKFILKLEGEILNIKNSFLNVMKSPLKRLEYNKAMSHKDPGTLSKFFVLEVRNQFRKNPPAGIDQRKSGSIESDFAVLISLIHALELLCQYGIKSFYVFIKSSVDNSDSSKSAAQQSKIKNEIMNNHEMSEHYKKFQEAFDSKDSIVPRELRHPKLIKLEEVVIEHFKKFAQNGTRVMIFTQYKESVYEITEMLSSHSEIKAMEFVGQSAVNGTHKAVTQKEQLAVVKKFRDGGYNTLVSTCVGEEGLDIGEVDLIICYDSQKSPIRLIQRMGRTGRKREGRIVILLTEGKEVSSYECSLSKKKNIYRIIQNGAKNFKFYPNNPLMIPKEIKPSCHKIFINPPLSDNEETEKSDKRRSKKKSIETDNQEDEQDEEDLDKTSKKAKKTTRKPKAKAANLSENSDTEDKPVEKKKRGPRKNKTDDANVTKRKSKKDSKLSPNATSIDGTPTYNTQLPDIDFGYNPRTNEPEKYSEQEQNENIEIDLDEDDDLRFLKTSKNNLDDILSHSAISNKETSSKESSIILNKTNERIKNDSIEAKSVFNYIETNQNEDHFEPYNEQMIIDETVAFISEESNSSSKKSVSPLAIRAHIIDKSMNQSNKSELEPRLIVEDTIQMSCNTSKSNSTIDQIIEDVLGQSRESSNSSSTKDDDEIKQDDLEKCFDLIETLSNKNETKMEIETLKGKENIPKLSLVNKNLAHLKKSPIKNNSTSTPMRSILKNKSINNESISYSPLILSQAVAATEQNTKFNRDTNGNSTSMVGMTQALELLQTPKPIIKNDNNPNRRIPFKIYFKSPDVVTFDMGTDLLDLFNVEVDDSKSNTSVVRFSSVKIKNSKNQESIICIDQNESIKDSSSNSKKRRLQFEESPKKDLTINSDDTDESIVQMKRKKAKKVLSDSSSASEANNSMDYDINAVLGNNYMEKYADDFESDESGEDLNGEDEEESDGSELDTRDIDYKKQKRKKEMKKANKFIDQEADLSSCDDCEVSEDESDEDDQYDLKDSLIDQNDYSHNESAMAIYRKSLKNAPFTKEYMNRPLPPITDDIFSQAISQTEPSQYAYDSFCVPEDEEIVYEKKSKKKKKKNKEEKTVENKKRRIKFMEETQASANSLVCLSSEGEAEKSIASKLGNSSYEIFGTNPNSVKKSGKHNFINSLSDNNDDEDDLLLIEAEVNVSKGKLATNKSIISINDELESKKSDFVPDIDSESEDFNNWLSNDIELPENKQSNLNNKQDTNCIFSVFNKPKEPIPKSSNINNSVITVTKAPVEIIKNKNWLIVDTSLLSSAADAIQNLKKIWDHDKLSIQSSIHCDFIVSQRYALLRFKWTDISSPSNKDHIIERLTKASSLYKKIMVLIQDDREINLVKTRSKYFDSLLANLTEASFILFSKVKTDEICNQVNFLSKTESTLGYGIEFDCTQILATKKRDISFYLSLPNISIIDAFNACNNYETISKFLNSSIQDLVLKLKLSDNKKAKQLIRFLNLSVENS